jgi:hypothetical protein
MRKEEKKNDRSALFLGRFMLSEHLYAVLSFEFANESRIPIERVGLKTEMEAE